MKPEAKKAKRVRRPRAQGTRKRHITSAEAKRRAARYLANKALKGLTVVDGEHAPCNIYGVSERETWVIQKPSFFPEPRPTQVVVVCKRTGRILYDGSAGDEG
jgi:hypothetical protein